MNKEQLEVIVVEDHLTMRRGVELLLRDAGFRVAGVAGTVDEARAVLARRRYDAVFPVPAASVVTEGERRSVWIAGRDGTAELRQVAIIDASDDALVSDGLRVGDQVIVDPPAGLHAGTRIALAR